MKIFVSWWYHKWIFFCLYFLEWVVMALVQVIWLFMKLISWKLNFQIPVFWGFRRIGWWRIDRCKFKDFGELTKYKKHNYGNGPRKIRIHSQKYSEAFARLPGDQKSESQSQIFHILIEKVLSTSSQTTKAII